MRNAKEERLNVRMPVELMDAIREAAERSGWGVSEQIRFELMERRGMWRGPYLPTKPTEENPVTDRQLVNR